MLQVSASMRLGLEKENLHKVRLNSPAGGWFPALQSLDWCISESTLPYADLFFSPYVKDISISASRLWNRSEIPRDVLPTLVSTISALPASALQHLRVHTLARAISRVYLEDLLSSVVLRCGSSLTEFSSKTSWPDAVVNHLIQLPHLHTWHIEGLPPSYSASSLPLVFPPLTKITLGKPLHVDGFPCSVV
jgi:hypothetical protein